MRITFITAVLALTLCAATGASSCSSVRGSPGPDGTSYTFGTLAGLLPGTPQRIVEVTEDLFEERELKVISSAATGMDGKIIARTALEKTIEVEVERKDDTNCMVSIRVGTFGDGAVSRDLFMSIKSKL